MGPPPVLDDAEMDIILAKFKTYGKQSAEIAGMTSFQQTHAVIPPPRRDASSQARSSTSVQRPNESRVVRALVDVEVSDPSLRSVNNSGSSFWNYGVGCCLLLGLGLLAKRNGLISQGVRARPTASRGAKEEFVYDGDGKWRRR